MSVKEQLLDVAEAMVREGGYNNFSFRDLADKVGIKSASVHYHFKTKPDLGVELVRRYTARFLQTLDTAASTPEQADAAPQAIVQRGFRDALHSSGMMCLCGLLAAEGDGLPPEVRQATRAFFEGTQQWLAERIAQQSGTTPEHAAQQALRQMAMLEGAMLMAKIHDDLSLFDQITGAVSDK
ncbi:TetR/AcrR family transcriptional regulator [Undibacterium squillarum]|uniref:TetR/AcrR family transcriptional regulator n=1 Tax=Undibacterium squillarum TaxID=1131567 RepID=UPI0035B0A179